LNPATAKVDRKALLAELQAIHEEQLRFGESQASLETRAIRHVSAWTRVVLAAICGPQAVASLCRALWSLAQALRGGAPAAAMAAALAEMVVHLPVRCACRVLLLPFLWLAATYLQDRHKEHPKHKALADRWKQWGLPASYGRWLPFLPVCCMPVSWLGGLSGAAVAYIAWAREQQWSLSCGFSLMAASSVVGSPLLLGGATAALGMGCLARPKATLELLRILIAAPGLCYQVVPKRVSDDLSYQLDRRFPDGLHQQSIVQSFLSALRPPLWQQTLAFDEQLAVVDHGNTWKQVHLAGMNGRSLWSSVGVEVQLHDDWRAAGSPLNSFLSSGDALASGGAPVNGSAPAAVAGKTNGSAPSAITIAGKHCDAAAGGIAGLASLVERICGGQGADALHGLDSMQAIQLCEAIRRELRRPVGVPEVLRCTDMEQLAKVVEKSLGDSAGVAKAQRRRPPSEHEPWRIWLCGLGHRTCTVDWMVSRRDGAKHFDVDALQRALDRLVARHAALRARNVTEHPMFEATYESSSLWQLHCTDASRQKSPWTQSRLGRWASSCTFAAWPRSTVYSTDQPEADVKLLMPTVAQVLCEGAKFDGEHAFWVAGQLLPDRASGELFHVCIVPIFKSAADAPGDACAVDVARKLEPEQVCWYVYAVLEHGYCDGPTGLPLFADLLRLYGEESGEASSASDQSRQEHHPVAALERLQERLLQSLKPLPEAEHPNDDIFHDGLVGWYYRKGYQRHLRFAHDISRLLRVAARENLGCSPDVAWLTCIAAAFFRLFPTQTRLDLYLIVTGRDGPGEESMIGYFSSRKLMPLEVGPTSRISLLGLADMINTIRRQRSWRRPRPFEKASAIEVNIVSQAADGLPLGFQEVRFARSAPRVWDRGGTSNMQVRLDQTARDDWTFRLQSHDAAFGEHWSTYYAQALGSVIVDMALRPLDAVVPTA